MYKELYGCYGIKRGFYWGGDGSYPFTSFQGLGVGRSTNRINSLSVRFPGALVWVAWVTIWALRCTDCKTNAFGPEIVSTDPVILSDALGGYGCSKRPVERAGHLHGACKSHTQSRQCEVLCTSLSRWLCYGERRGESQPCTLKTTQSVQGSKANAGLSLKGPQGHGRGSKQQQGHRCGVGLQPHIEGASSRYLQTRVYITEIFPETWKSGFLTWNLPNLGPGFSFF